MQDIFDQKILCENCNKEMQKIQVSKNGFPIRALECPKCNQQVLHPIDKKEFEDFQNLKKKHYRVKLRFVGNSYAVSIPREIINFMSEQESQMKKMVDLCFEQMDKISLNF